MELALLEKRVTKVLKVTLVPMVVLVQEEAEEKLDHLDHLERRVHQERWAGEDQRAKMDHMVLLVLRVLLVHKEYPVWLG